MIDIDILIPLLAVTLLVANVRAAGGATARTSATPVRDWGGMPWTA